MPFYGGNVVSFQRELTQVLRKQKATYRSIAQKLNESGFKTSKGN